MGYIKCRFCNSLCMLSPYFRLSSDSYIRKDFFPPKFKLKLHWCAKSDCFRWMYKSLERKELGEDWVPDIVLRVNHTRRISNFCMKGHKKKIWGSFTCAISQFILLLSFCKPWADVGCLKRIKRKHRGPLRFQSAGQGRNIVKMFCKNAKLDGFSKVRYLNEALSPTRWQYQSQV